MENGYIAEFDVKSIYTGKNILKHYAVKTEDEAKKLADSYKSICHATAFTLKPMSEKYEISVHEDPASDSKFEIAEEAKA